jgi:hypothetical protein
MQQAEKDKVRPANVARTTARHDRNRENQELRRQANVVRRKMGVQTPWEVSKFSRRFERQWSRDNWAEAA